MKSPYLAVTAVLLTSGLVLSACSRGAPGARITLSGAYALQPMVTRWADQFEASLQLVR